MWRLLSAVIFLFIVSDRVGHAKKLKFPKGFSFGAASAAYQIEGGWNLDGKGPNIWDNLTHSNPSLIIDRTNGDIAADSYHFYKDDVKALKNAGFQHYRFSIAWSRILPDGFTENPKGIEYYHKLIDELIFNNIEPMATMYHFDLPQSLQDLGGFLNPEFINYFELYADTLYKHFGSKVKIWMTFNEPFEQCLNGYGKGDGAFFPLQNTNNLGGEYLCAHHLILAHAKAYHLYKDKYFKSQRGMVGYAPNVGYHVAANKTDKVSAERGYQFQLGWFANPIFSDKGNYPKMMIDDINRNSAREGRKWPRIPTFTKSEIKYIRGTADFLGINYYTGRVTQLNKNADKMKPSWEKDQALQVEIDPKWREPVSASSSWLVLVPGGLRETLKWIKNAYNNIPVLITENGWSDTGILDDDDRITYLKVNYADVAKAINIDKCNVIGHSVWSIIDNFEWRKGYTERFGIYYVNFTSPFKERIPKKSVSFIQEITKNRFVEDYE
jgi:beta-glucosidase/6-phospho-beta-glucosidase/beta-galactosidase